MVRAPGGEGGGGWPMGNDAGVHIHVWGASMHAFATETHQSTVVLAFRAHACLRMQVHAAAAASVVSGTSARSPPSPSDGSPPLWHECPPASRPRTCSQVLLPEARLGLLTPQLEALAVQQVPPDLMQLHLHGPAHHAHIALSRVAQCHANKVRLHYMHTGDMEHATTACMQLQQCDMCCLRYSSGEHACMHVCALQWANAHGRWQDSRP